MSEQNKLKNVTKEEMDHFIKNYPNRLIKDVCAISEPPLLTFNDFTDGKVWPESVVASYFVAHRGDLATGFKILETLVPE